MVIREDSLSNDLCPALPQHRREVDRIGDAGSAITFLPSENRAPLRRR